MNYLVGDIGNTSTKLSILNDNFKPIKTYSFETKKLFINSFMNNFFKKKINNKINKIVLSLSDEKDFAIANVIIFKWK